MENSMKAVKKDTKWIYAGHRLEVKNVYMEESTWDDPGSGRHLCVNLEGTRFEKEKGYKSTVIQEKDLILEY